MFLSIREIGVEIDLGRNASGAFLQRKESDLWFYYLIDCEPVVNPFDLETLPPGTYRLVESPVLTTSD